MFRIRFICNQIILEISRYRSKVVTVVAAVVVVVVEYQVLVGEYLAIFHFFLCPLQSFVYNSLTYRRA